MDKKLMPVPAKVNLKTKDDIVSLLETAASDVKETPTSVALANLRTSIAKARMGLEKQHIDYLRFKDKHGTSVVGAQEFFMYKPQLEKKT